MIGLDSFPFDSYLSNYAFHNVFGVWRNHGAIWFHENDFLCTILVIPKVKKRTTNSRSPAFAAVREHTWSTIRNVSKITFTVHSRSGFKNVRITVLFYKWILLTISYFTRFSSVKSVLIIRLSLKMGVSK